MTVLLNRNYGAYPAGSIVSLNSSTEAALIAQNIAQSNAGPVTPGNVTSNEHNGRAAFAAGTQSVTVTNPNITANSRVNARIDLAVADGTLVGPLRIVPAAGSFTVYGNANSTGVVPFDWDIAATGLTPNQ